MVIIIIMSTQVDSDQMETSKTSIHPVFNHDFPIELSPSPQQPHFSGICDTNPPHSQCQVKATLTTAGPSVDLAQEKVTKFQFKVG